MVKFIKDPVVLRKIANALRVIAIIAVFIGTASAFFARYVIAILFFAALAITLDITAGQMRHRANQIEWEEFISGWDNKSV